jgi:sugar phosphate isomerase/epimerase
MIRLGGHGLPIDSDDPFAFARAHRDFGYAAAYCPPVELADTARLRAIEKAFAAENIIIAEVGIWRNLTSSDPEARRADRAFAREKLAIADEVGARCAVTFIGTRRAGVRTAPAPENFADDAFDAAVEAVRDLIDSVRPKRTRFALELMQYALPDSADVYLDLIRAVDRPAFAAHVDPVNLVMTPRVYFNTGALIRELFAKLGPRIVSCHAKDIVLHHQAALHLDETLIGEGMLDYRTYLAELDRLDDVPLMLEHLPAKDYAAARDRVFAVGDATGISFVGREAPVS